MLYSNCLFSGFRALFFPGVEGPDLRQATFLFLVCQLQTQKNMWEYTNV